MEIAPSFLYALVLLAAVANAVWNSLVKNAGDRLLMMAMIRLVGLVFGLALLPFVPWPGPDVWIWLACSTVAHYAAYALLIESYRIGDLSLVYPIMRGTAPILLALIAYLAIGERLNLGQMAAVALTSCGILMLVSGKGGSLVAIGVAFATSITMAVYSLFDGIGVRASPSVLGFMAWLEILTCVGMLGFTLTRRRKAIMPFVRANGFTGLFAGALSVGGYLAFLAAAKVLPLAPVSALRESSVIFGTVIGAVVLKEGFGARRITAAILVTGGIAALALAGQI
jgi:drug/metabolite transporter (DMT)-like permease